MSLTQAYIVHTLRPCFLLLNLSFPAPKSVFPHACLFCYKLRPPFLFLPSSTFLFSFSLVLLFSPSLFSLSFSQRLRLSSRALVAFIRYLFLSFLFSLFLHSFSAPKIVLPTRLFLSIASSSFFRMETTRDRHSYATL